MKKSAPSYAAMICSYASSSGGSGCCGRRGEGGKKSKLRSPGDSDSDMFAGVLGERAAELKLKLCSSPKDVFMKRGESEASV